MAAGTIVFSPLGDDIGFEQLRATARGFKLYELQSIPFLSSGLALGDLVQTEFRDGKPIIVGVAKSSGDRTLSIRALDEGALSSFLATLHSWHGLIEVQKPIRMIAIDIRGDMPLPQEAETALKELSELGRLDYAYLTDHDAA